MSVRTVEVRLKANIADFRAGMAAAGKSVDDVQRRLAQGDAKTKANVQEISRGMLLVGGAAVTGALVSVAAWAKFDKQMSGVKAVTNATVGEMGDLRQAAMDAGAATVFSASEAAQAEAELAKAGVSTADVLGGALRGSLDLAAAGGLDLANAATIAAQAMNIFKLQGRDVTHIADVLAAGANKSAADVGQLGDALRQGGLSAAQADIGLEETVGTLSAFADNALIGSDAGTSFKTMIASLIPTSEKAAGAMEDIGLHAYDTQGNFIGLEAVAGQLQQGLGKLTAEERNNALQTIFGNDAKRAAAVLYEEGAAGIRDYTSAVNDQGAAARMAATQLDNLSGDVEQLKGSFETALIGSGSGSNGAAREAVQFATKLVNTYGELPSVVQGGVVAIAGIGGAAVAGLGAIGMVAPKVQTARKALRDLGAAGEFADRGLGRAARAAGMAGIAFAALGTIDAIFNGVNDEFLRFVTLTEGLAGPSTTAQISALTDEMERLRAISDKGLNTDLGFTNIHWTDWTNGAAAAGDKADFLEGKISDLKVQQKIEAKAAKEGGDANTGLAKSFDQVSPAAEEATDAIDDYKGALDNLNGVNISAARAQLQLAQSYRDARKAAEGGAKVTDDETSALLDLADQANQTAGAIIDQTGSQDKANATLREARRRFVETAVAMGYTREEARGLADDWLQIPTKRNTDYTTTGVDGAQTELATLRATILGIPTHRRVSVTVGTVNRISTIPIDGQRAAGGPVTAGHLYRVNESGVELFRPSVSGSIVPAGPTSALLAGSGAHLAAASPLSLGQHQTFSTPGDGRIMGDLIVYTQQERVEEVLPRVMDAQMYRMRG